MFSLRSQTGAVPVHVSRVTDPTPLHVLLRSPLLRPYPGAQLYVATVPKSCGAPPSVENNICPLSGGGRSSHVIAAIK